jgi:hypothetical protein
MTKLETLYNSIKGLKELGLPLNEETLKAVDELEEELIKNEIIPRLSESIEPIITKIQRPIVLVVDYIPDERLSVRLTRKRVITDEQETKQYELVTTKQSKKKTDRAITSSPKSKKTKLAVEFPDGTRIERNYAYETLLSAIEKIGAKQVAELNIQWLGLPLVSKTKDDFYNQHEITGGWLVVTHSSTITKRQQLERISNQLGLNLKIEIVE